MDIDSIRPSTLNGIRQLAKKIGAKHNIAHLQALELASRQAGFENFTHAKRQLSEVAVQRGFPVYLSVHWAAPRRGRDEPRPTGLRAGREILRVDLSRPLPEIVAKHRVRSGRGLHGFRMEYDDHLEFRTNVQGQDVARELLLSAARSLRFMEGTGLQPVSTAKYNAISQKLMELPGHDHVSDWFDPVTGSYLCLDEPYAEAIKNRVEQREQWLERNGFKVIAPADWEGIYYAGECKPWLISRDDALLQRVANSLAKVEAITEPVTWPYETGVCNDDFVSPNRQADAKPRRRRPGPSWKDRNGATPYGGAAGIPSKWRPAKAMPFELHQQLGPLIQGLGSSTFFSQRVHLKLSSVRSVLEDWLLMEHGNQMGGAANTVYYGGSDMVVGNSEAALVEMLMAARVIVERGYDDCKPRSQLLAAFDSGLSEMGRAHVGVVSSAPVTSATV